MRNQLIRLYVPFLLLSAAQGANIQDYGAVPGESDSSAAIQYVHDHVLPPEGGTITAPAGTYCLYQTVRITKRVVLQGEGGTEFSACGAPDMDLFEALPFIWMLHTDVPPDQPQYIAQEHADHAITFRDFSVSSPAGPKTGGTAIIVGSSGPRPLMGARVENIRFTGQYRDLLIYNATNATVENCRFLGAAYESILLDNSNIPDGGDHTINNNWFVDPTRSMTPGGPLYAIRLLAGGGLKVTGNKFLMYDYALYMDLVDWARTGILIFSGNSAECQREASVRLGGPGGWQLFQIHDNQFTIGFEPEGILHGEAIRFTDNKNRFSIQGNVFLRGSPAIRLDNTRDGIILGNSFFACEKAVQQDHTARNILIANNFIDCQNPQEGPSQGTASQTTPNPHNRR